MFFEKIYFDLFFIAFALVFSIGAAISDVKTRKISNKYNLAFFIAAFFIKVTCFVITKEPAYLISSLFGFLVGFIILLPFFALRLAGGGDVKLLAVLGFILGWQKFLWVFCLTTLIDGLLLLPLRLIKNVYLLLALPGSLNSKLINIKESLAGLKRNNKNPYALPVALGCLSFGLLYVFATQYLKEISNGAFDLHLYF
ncbi:MAG TPA: prepilin peptidase [Vampirovibrionales bacterium]